MAKRPPPRMFPSDDYVVLQGGVEYHPHEGEWVQIIGRPSIGDIRAIWHFNALTDEEPPPFPEPPPDDADDEAKRAHAEEMVAYRQWREARNQEESDRFDELAKAIAPHIAAWNWTDYRGEPLIPWNAEDEQGQPYTELDGDPAIFAALSAEEVYYLRTLIVRGETADERGNDSNGSPTSSSTEVRSRTKRT